MTISEMIHEIPHMRYRLESAKHKETLDEIEEVLRHYKEVNEVLDKIRAEIDENISHYEHFSSPNTANGLMIAKKIIDKYKAESEETETWNGIHAQITAPKGTFDKLWEDAESEG